MCTSKNTFKTGFISIFAFLQMIHNPPIPIGALGVTFKTKFLDFFYPKIINKNI